MKTDNLEQFILNNRQSFDSLEPSSDLWKGIKKPEREKKSIKSIVYTFSLRAAAVVVIFISSYYFHDFMNKNESQHSAQNSTLQVEGNPLYKNLIEAELYYSSEISFKKQEFFRLTSGSPALQSEINMELANLDEIFKELKSDLNDDADNHEVIEAMIQNYRIKLEILVDMLGQIKSSQKNNNNNEEIHNTI
jgi:hypothetical protein